MSIWKGEPLMWQQVLKVEVQPEREQVDKNKAVSSWRKTKTKYKVYMVLMGLGRVAFRMKRDRGGSGTTENLDFDQFIEKLENRELPLSAIKRVLLGTPTDAGVSKFHDMDEEEFLRHNDNDDLLPDDEWKRNYETAVSVVRNLETEGKRTLSPQITKLANNFLRGSHEELLSELKEALEGKRDTGQPVRHRFIEDLRSWENKNDKLVDYIKELNDENITDLFVQAGFGEALEEEVETVQSMQPQLALGYLQKVAKSVGNTRSDSMQSSRLQFLPYRKGVSEANKKQFYDDVFYGGDKVSPGLAHIIMNPTLGDLDNLGRQGIAESRLLMGLNREIKNTDNPEMLSPLAREFSDVGRVKSKFLESIEGNATLNQQYSDLVESQSYAIPEKVREILLHEQITLRDWRFLKDSDFKHLVEDDYSDENAGKLETMAQKVKDSLERMVTSQELLQTGQWEKEGTTSLRHVAHQLVDTEKQNKLSGETYYYIDFKLDTAQKDKDALKILFTEKLESQIDRMTQEAKEFFSDYEGDRKIYADKGGKVITRHWRKIVKKIKETNPNNLSFGKLIVTLAALEYGTNSGLAIEDAAKEYFAYLQHVGGEEEDIAEHETKVSDKREKLVETAKQNYSSIRDKFLEQIRVKINKILANPDKYSVKGKFNMRDWLSKEIGA